MNRNPQSDLQKRPAGMEILLAETQAGKARAKAHWAAVEAKAAQAAVLGMIGGFALITVTTAL